MLVSAHVITAPYRAGRTSVRSRTLVTRFSAVLLRVDHVLAVVHSTLHVHVLTNCGGEPVIVIWDLVIGSFVRAAVRFTCDL